MYNFNAVQTSAKCINKSKCNVILKNTVSDTDIDHCVFTCAVQRDGDRSVLERLPISVCAEISQVGGFPGQPETQSTTRARATGTAAGRGTHTCALKHMFYPTHKKILSALFSLLYKCTQTKEMY